MLIYIRIIFGQVTPSVFREQIQTSLNNNQILNAKQRRKAFIRLIKSNIKEVTLFDPHGNEYDSPANYYDDEIDRPPMTVGIKLIVCILFAY